MKALKNLGIGVLFIAFVISAILFFPIGCASAQTPGPSIPVNVPELPKLIEDVEAVKQSTDELTERADAAGKALEALQAQLQTMEDARQEDLEDILALLEQTLAETKKNDEPEDTGAEQPLEPPKPKPPVSEAPGLPIEGAAYDITVDGVPVQLSLELDPWIDGTKVYASALSGSGWYAMIWAHEAHVRIVAGYGGDALRAADGGEAIDTGPVTICFRADGDDLACHDLDGFTTGQEIHHEIGQRPWIRMPSDIVDMGLWPRMQPVERYIQDIAAGTFSDDLAPMTEPKPTAVKAYRPLVAGHMQPWMPAQGGQQAVHSTTGFASLAVWPGSPNADAHLALINVSAQEAASWPWHRFTAGTYRPIDLSDDYYLLSHWGPDGIPGLRGNIDDLAERDGRRDGWAFDGAHLKIPGWEMYLLNGDPYYLRQWQMGLIAAVLDDMPAWRAQGLDGPSSVVNRRQPRAYGKGLMLLLRLVQVMPEGDWNWLQPKAHFETMLANTAKQSLWLAEQPGTLGGVIPASFGNAQSIKWGMSHSAFQGLWSTGWAVHLGYDEFRPLYERLTAAAFAYWDGFGPQMADFSKSMQTLHKKTPFDSLESVIAAAKAVHPEPVGPNSLYSQYVWREERAQGMTASLSQWFPEWESQARGWAAAHADYARCYGATKRKDDLAEGVWDSLNCPAGVEKYSGPLPDWMMAIGAD